MEKQYYIPTIEEFHVGFEYEQDYDHVMHISERYEKVNGEYITKSTWSPKVFTDKDWEFLDHLVRTEFVRVKYLDQEDIESLGWKEGEWSKVDTQYAYYELGKFALFEHGNNLWDITIPSKGRKVGENFFHYTVFEGTIKNKSELKTLMKWLKIK